jgi:hypothetical protein
VAFCTACGTQLAGGAFCAQCGAPVSGSRVRAEYRPSTAWLATAVVAWLLADLVVVTASLRSNDRGTAYAVGVFIGAAIFSLIVPAVIRVGYVAIFHRGPQLWERALYSPWLWCIGAVLNVMAANGRSHPHG